MITEPLTGARKPEQTDGPLGGLQIANVIDDLAPNTIPSFANAAARNTAYSNWVAAGGVMRKGLKSHTQNDNRDWRYDGAAWQYAGGAPPPIVLATLVGGWTSLAGYAPVCWKDASGTVHLDGGVTNDTAYTPAPTGHDFLTLPVGYRPSVTLAPLALVNATPPAVGIRITPGGVISSVNGAAIGAGTMHSLTGISFHPGYAGGALS